MVEFSNFHHQIGDNLKFLFQNLGLEEVFKRLDDLDGKGGPPEDPEFNPTNDRMVQPNLEGIGRLSGGPNEENEGTLDVVDPKGTARLLADVAEAAEAAKAKEEEEKSAKPTSSRSTSSSTTRK